jgi:hypothetical protein
MRTGWNGSGIARIGTAERISQKKSQQHVLPTVIQNRMPNILPMLTRYLRV